METANKSKRIYKCLFWIFTIIFAAFAILSIINICCKELTHNFHGDSGLYWTVGRGMLNGIKPYSGLYENKPLGIFLISALSFALTDDIILCNIFSLICHIIIAVVPAACVLEYCRQQGIIKNKRKSYIYAAIALAFGLVLMKYCKVNSGLFMPESIGAAFIGLYFLTILHMNTEKAQSKRKLIIWTVVAGFFVMCGVMFKEPFVVISVAGSLLLVESVRDFIFKTVIPTAIGGVLSLLLLLVCGVLPEYFSIYLKNMFGNHISVYGSPFERMLNFGKIISRILRFSPMLLAVVLISLSVFLLYAAFKKGLSIRMRIWRTASLIICLFAASFSIGLGGQYFGHHFVFAAPLYMLMFFWLCKIMLTELSDKFPKRLCAVCFTVLVIQGYDLSFPKQQDALGEDTFCSVSKNAQYVDSLLDYYGEDTYQYLGMNFQADDLFYGLTHHSPKGPCFVQDRYNFEDENNWFSQSLLNQLDEVNIVIFSEFNMPKTMTEKVQQILDTEFTTEPADKYAETDVPDSFDCVIYYRIEKYG